MEVKYIMLKFHSVKTDKQKETSLKFIFDNRKGFTFLEWIVVISILAIILVIVVPRFFGFIESSKISADQATVAILNKITLFSRTTTLIEDPFVDQTKNSQYLLEKIVEDGYLSMVVKPQTKDAKFQWIFDKEKWYLLLKDSLLCTYSLRWG